MKNVINLSLDIETLSLQPDAAIISLAVLPFNIHDAENLDKVPWTDEHGRTLSLDCDTFVRSVNATSCATLGMHFDMETIRWWQNNSDESKLALFSAKESLIGEALEELSDYMQNIRASVPGCELRIWAQGTDFDIPILKSAYQKALSTSQVPWRHTELRDARTYILTILEQLGADMAHPYDYLKPYRPKQEKDWVKHDALLDARQTAINVALCHRFLSQRFSAVTSFD